MKIGWVDLVLEDNELVANARRDHFHVEEQRGRRWHSRLECSLKSGGSNLRRFDDARVRVVSATIAELGVRTVELHVDGVVSRFLVGLGWSECDGVVGGAIGNGVEDRSAKII